MPTIIKAGCPRNINVVVVVFFFSFFLHLFIQSDDCEMVGHHFESEMNPLVTWRRFTTARRAQFAGDVVSPRHVQRERGQLVAETIQGKRQTDDGGATGFFIIRGEFKS